ncbi:hypothetical protein WJX74_008348 [Apatococcus lobatus]|uniref:Mediator of RNA polymerase II transcription subunit 14 n=1 Tax=Apatococcus lobatus TaxID=904363 RepID=A0AAW1RQA1_9CHLO
MAVVRSSTLAFVGRLFFVALFITSAVQKLQSFDATGGPIMKAMQPKMDHFLARLEHFTGIDLPLEKQAYVYLLAFATFLEISGAVLFLFNSALGAWLLVLFVTAVTPIMHNFWDITDVHDRMLDTIMFFKNLSILGALFFYLGNQPKKLRPNSVTVTGWFGKSAGVKRYDHLVFTAASRLTAAAYAFDGMAEILDSRILTGAPGHVNLKAVLENVVHTATGGLQALAQVFEHRPIADRKQSLLQNLHHCRQHLLRLHVLTTWAQKARAVREAGRVVDVATRHAGALRLSADELYHLHMELEASKAPVFDILTALDVLQTGGYDILPKVIAEGCSPAKPSPAKIQGTVHRLDFLLHRQLQRAGLPDGTHVSRIQDGVALLHCANDWEVCLSLSPAKIPEMPDAHAHVSTAQPKLALEEGQAMLGSQQKFDGDGAQGESSAVGEVATCPAASRSFKTCSWRLISIQLLPGFKKGLVLQAAQAESLRADLEARMWAAAISASTASLKQSEENASCDGDTIHQSPLDLLQNVLQNVASRLLLNQVILDLKHLLAVPSPWAGCIRREASKAFQIGVRIPFWLEVPCIYSDDLQLAGKSGSSEPCFTQMEPDVPRSSRGTPVVEIGIHATGGMGVGIPQAWLPVYRSADNIGSQGRLDLLELQYGNVKLSSATGDVTSLLLDAAALASKIQLDGLAATVRARGKLNASGGSVSTASSSSLSDSTPGTCIHFSAGGAILLEVSMHLRTGCFCLTPGAGLGKSGVDAVAGIRKAEEKLQMCQQEAKQKLPAPPHVGRAHLEAAAAVLEELAVKLAWRARFCQLVAAARGMTLHPQSTSPRTIKAFLETHPQTARINERASVLLDFPDFPESQCPPDPGVHGTKPAKGSPDAQAVPVADSSPAQNVQCRFHLLAQPGLSSSGGARWQHILLMSSSDQLGAPAQIIKVLRTPAVVTRQAPDTAQPAPEAGKKRKRKDGESDGEPLECADATPQAEMVQAPWGKQQENELAQVVDWAQERMNWELLQFQLKGLELPFAEELQASSKRHPSSEPKMPEKPSSALDDPEACISLKRSLRLFRYDQALQRLDACCTALPPAAHPLGGSKTTWRSHYTGQPQVTVGIPSGAIAGEWVLRVASRYFAGLPLTADNELSASGAAVVACSDGFEVHCSFARGDSVLNAVKDLAAILRLHTFATRTATVIRAWQKLQTSAATPSEPEAVQPLLSPDACSIAAHATVNQHPADQAPPGSDIRLAPDVTPPSTSVAQQSSLTPAAMAGTEASEPGIQLTRPDAARPDAAGSSRGKLANAPLSWTAPNGLAITIHDINFTSIFLAAHSVVPRAMTSQTSLHLPLLEPDQGDQMSLPTGDEISAQQGATHEGLPQRLGARTSLDSLASLAFGPESLQPLSSWGWASDAIKCSSGSLQDLEVLADLPAEVEGHAATQQQQPQLQQQAVSASSPSQQPQMLICISWAAPKRSTRRNYNPSITWQAPSTAPLIAVALSCNEASAAPVFEALQQMAEDGQEDLLLDAYALVSSTCLAFLSQLQQPILQAPGWHVRALPSVKPSGAFCISLVCSPDQVEPSLAQVLIDMQPAPALQVQCTIRIQTFSPQLDGAAHSVDEGRTDAAFRHIQALLKDDAGLHDQAQDGACQGPVVGQSIYPWPPCHEVRPAGLYINQIGHR